MFEHAKKLWEILTVQEKRRFGLLLVAVVVMGFLEVVGIAAIFPFMQLASEPEAIEANRWLAWLYAGGGFESPRSFLFVVGVGVLVVLAVSNFARAMAFWLQQKIVWSTAHSIAERLLEAYLRQPYEFFLQRNSADLGKQVLAEVNQLAKAVMWPAAQVVARSVVVLIIFGLLVAVDFMLALIVLVVLGGGYASIYLLVRTYLDRLGNERFATNQLRYRMANEALATIKVVKIWGREHYFLRRFAEASKRYAWVQPRQQVLGKAPRYLVETLAFGGIMAVILYLLADGSTVQEVIPILSLYAMAGYRLLPSMQKVYNQYSQLRYNVPTIEAVYGDFQATHDAPALPGGEQEPLPFQSEFRLDKISFSYQGTADHVLEEIELSVERGESVAFVGPTGSGKTTLVDIIMGVLAPTEGQVLVDDIALDDEAARRWQAIAGYVPQEVSLYDETIRRNIVFGIPDDKIDEDRVWQVAQLANIHEFIKEELPEGYDTWVGERGARLSGGQRQRIGLARALYHDPQVLVLDEATSALDGATEDAVMEAIRRASEGLTTIMIAHRLATVRDCDRIYLLRDGRIVDAGTYDELIDENELFRDMAKLAS